MAILGVLTLAYGYRASLFSDDPTTRWFARSMLLLAVCIAARRIAWDIVHPVVNASVDQRPVNIAINLVTVAGVYCGLKARHLLIPPEDRRRWRWWSAWAHPAVWQIRVDRPLAPGEER